MGAYFNIKRFADQPRADVLKAVASYQDELRYECGHGPYSGHLGTQHGCTILKQEFDTFDAAEEYIMETSHKSNPPMLARIKGGGWVLAGWCRS